MEDERLYFFLAKTQLMKSHGLCAYYGLPNFLFPFRKAFSFPCWRRGVNLAHDLLRLQTPNLKSTPLLQKHLTAYLF